MAKYKGIDVSALGGAVDFSKVRAAGYSFAIIRAGYCGCDGLITAAEGCGANFGVCNERSG